MLPWNYLFSAFTSLLGICIEIMRSAVRLKICAKSAIAAENKKYKSLIRCKRKKYDKILFLAKSKLNKMEVLISKALINSNISHDEFILIK